MIGMENIGEAILDKVKAEAEGIIREAEEKAKAEIEKAKQRQEAKLLEEKNKMLEEAREEASRILAQAVIKARQEVLAVKTRVIDEIISRARKELSGFSGGEGSFLHLIKEAVDALDVDKVRIYVLPKDVSAVQKLLKEDKELVAKVVEIKEYECLGGVVAEGIDGKFRVDDTYEARLEMLLPKLLPEIGKELF